MLLKKKQKNIRLTSDQYLLKWRRQSYWSFSEHLLMAFIKVKYNSYISWHDSCPILNWLTSISPVVTLDTYSCMDPGIPVNGMRFGHDLSIGSTVSFFCDPGYRLSHDEPLLCEKNHFWSHPLPSCDGTCTGRSAERWNYCWDEKPLQLKQSVNRDMPFNPFLKRFTHAHTRHRCDLRS